MNKLVFYPKTNLVIVEENNILFGENNNYS